MPSIFLTRYCLVVNDLKDLAYDVKHIAQDTEDKERPCGPKKRLQARLLFKTLVSTDRKFLESEVSITHAPLQTATVHIHAYNTQFYVEPNFVDECTDMLEQTDTTFV